MSKKEFALIIILIMAITAFSTAIMSEISENKASDGHILTREIISNGDFEDKGRVEVIKNIGNPDSEKIAYVVGVHPLENETHRTLLKILPNMSDLKYSYDIYIINVTEDIGHYGDGASDDSPGRQNGQNLALKYVYPRIRDGGYRLAVDIHSNVGAYPFKTFVFSPVKESLSVDYAQRIAENSQNISYYSPDSTTSGPYLTIPLNENGVPAFYFEEYSFAPQNEKDMHMIELIRSIDELNL